MEKILLAIFLCFSFVNGQPKLSAVGHVKDSASQKFTVGLDNYFNCEYKNEKRFHYTWEDEENSGYSELGKLIETLGGNILSIETAPTEKILQPLSMYIIVDPDIPSENPNPNYIDKTSRKVIVDWVKSGGVLLVLANDSLNCEFTNLNLLTDNFGIHFNGDSKNRVVGKNYDMGKIDSFPKHPLFEEVKSIYLKEISTLALIKPAKCVLEEEGNCIIASSEFGKGFVFAVGDPWLYNEYYDNRKLPTEFENYKAAKNLFGWLKNKIHRK